MTPVGGSMDEAVSRRVPWYCKGMGDWSLANLFPAASRVAAELLHRWPQHQQFFDQTVSTFLSVGWVHWDALQQLKLAAHERVARQQGLFYLPPGSTAWCARWFPNGGPGSDTEAQLWCLHLGSVVVLRSLTHSGFLAFGGLVTEAIGAHRRTIEALVHLELLVDRQDLCRSYWELARQVHKNARAKNSFKAAFDRVQRDYQNKQSVPDSKLTPLQLALRKRCHDSGLHFGPHAGPQHALMAVRPGRMDFFDANSKGAGIYAWRFAWETAQLANELVPKLAWIDQVRWTAALAKVRTSAQALQREDMELTGVPESHPIPWTSFDDAADADELRPANE